MGKVKVSTIEFEALESFKFYYKDKLGDILEQVLILRMQKSFYGIRAVLNEMDLERFINSLLKGYEL